MTKHHNNHKVLIIGSSNTDMVATPAHFPKPGETLVGGEFYTFPGGKGANQAIAAQRAGGSVTFVGGFGSDSLGDNALSALKHEGINTRHCHRFEDMSSGVGIILVSAETGENMIVVALGANLMLMPEHLSDIPFDQYAVALFQLENKMETVEYGLEKAFNAGCTTILNPAPAHKLSDATLSHIRILTPNEHELKLVAGVSDDTSVEQAARILISKGVQHIVVTCGKDGAYHFCADRTEHFPTKQVVAVDTVGAGDCFSGCLAAALANGEPMRDAIQFAVMGATISVTAKGAQPGMPTAAQIRDFIGNNPL